MTAGAQHGRHARLSGRHAAWIRDPLFDCGSGITRHDGAHERTGGDAVMKRAIADMADGTSEITAAQAGLVAIR